MRGRDDDRGRSFTAGAPVPNLRKMDTTHEDECRYCEQDRRGGWIYCRSCGRLLSRSNVITVRPSDRRPAADGSRGRASA
jgi:hypothetical protein